MRTSKFRDWIPFVALVAAILLSTQVASSDGWKARNNPANAWHQPCRKGGWCENNGFAPNQLPGCVLWLRADMGVTLVNGSVTRWADLSGNGNDVTGNPGHYPNYVVNDSGLANKPSLQFIQANGLYLRGLWTKSLPTPYTVIAIVNGGASASPASTIFDDYTIEEGYSIFYIPSPIVDIEIFANGSALAIPCSSIPGSGAVMVSHSSGTTTTIEYNGTSTSGSGSNGITLTGASIGILGAAAGDYFNGNIAEEMVFNHVLSTTEIAIIKQYILTRYNVTL